MDEYEFVLWDSRGDQLIHELEQQDVDFQLAFYVFVQKTAQSGWLRSQRMETLDSRFETYALSVTLGDARHAMLTRTTSGNRYTYLDFTA